MNKLAILYRRAGDALFRKMPVPLHWRSPHAQVSRFLAKSDHWDADKMATWQLRQLNRIVRHAQRYCPGYQRKLRGARFDGAIERLEDLAELPFLTKDELRADSIAFTARNFAPESLRAITSGGTTGTPTRFMVDARSYDAVFDAWRHAMWRRAGYALGMPCLDLTWAFTGDGHLRQLSESNRLYLSIHALDANMLGTWWQQVSALRPGFIIGYPSTATALAKILPEGLPSVHALLLASETLTTDQRDVLRASFPHARIFQWYGMSEAAGFASGCEHVDAFHHWPQSGLLEVIGENGRPVRAPGQAGEIVLTGFVNRATPFIRYRTGDIGILGARCTHCWRAHAVLTKIDGRMSDFLLGAKGRVVSISALNFHSDEFRRVFAHQFIQDEPGRVILRIVPLPGFVGEDAEAICRLIGEKLGDDIVLVLEQAASIARTPRGKQPLILQRCRQIRANPEHRSVTPSI